VVLKCDILCLLPILSLYNYVYFKIIHFNQPLILFVDVTVKLGYVGAYYSDKSYCFLLVKLVLLTCKYAYVFL